MVLEAGCGPMRARLGPTAWVVLEELLLRADPAGQVSDGVRGLAAGLGLDKDTVARGLRRLRAAGMVSPILPAGYAVEMSACHGISVTLASDADQPRPHHPDRPAPAPLPGPVAHAPRTGTDRPARATNRPTPSGLPSTPWQVSLFDSQDGHSHGDGRGAG